MGKFFLLFGGIWLLLSIPFMFVGVHLLKTEQRFVDEGVTVPGKVLNKRIEEKWERDRERKTDRLVKTYWASYSFETKEGRHVEAEHSLDSDEWSKLEAGSPVEVQYLSKEPEENRIAREPSNLGGYLFCGFSCLGMLIGIVSLVAYFKRKSFVTRLLREGVLTDGSVTSVAPGTLSVNNEQQWQIQFSFKDGLGRAFAGKSDHMPPDKAANWKVGDKGRIRYDKNDPAKNLWVGSD